MGSTAFHPQTNGENEQMHHTLTEYMKAYVEKEDQWDEHLPLCMHSYNTTDHESTGYSPHELVFGQRARTPTSCKISSSGQTSNKYLNELVTTLTEMRTIAAMIQVQAKYRSKYYYDRKLNTRYYLEGEIIYVLKEPSKGKFHA
ncbi:uncharacterized protein LOC106641015 [Copidosoma floridanum]|uniref:uncharacterized protein LOC106641015 n=1 Tax=Copidosoma floridanum TaxID=29053 RepID=UPI0006C93F0B|nr:uncharacterized protein LOC106641015 [Copidosoma floridanum]